MCVGAAYLCSGFQTSHMQIRKAHEKKMKVLQRGAVGRGEEAEAALGGTEGAGGGEKFWEYGKDLTLPWG